MAFEEQPLSEVTILAVDDEEFIRELVRRALEPLNYRVIEAENGTAALEIALREDPDLIITDWMMPEMDGIKLCEHLKRNSRTQEIPVILLTARAEIQDKLQGLQIGADDYISKPFERRELQLRAEKLLRRKRRERYLNPLSQVLGDQFTRKGIESLGHELEMAREIQMHMSPVQFPKLDGGEIYARMEPAHIVGGDFYDVIPISEGKYGLVVGDVSGKGMGAALLMSITRSLVRLLAHDGSGPGESLLKISDALYRDTPARTFVTLLFGILDRDGAALRFTYASAGHERPILVRADGATEWLSKFGMAAGIFEDNQGYPVESVRMEAGDTLLIYTDGVTTARKDVSLFYGEEGVMAYMTENRTKTVKEIVDGLFEEARKFNDPRFTPDDTTAMAVKAF